MKKIEDLFLKAAENNARLLGILSSDRSFQNKVYSFAEALKGVYQKGGKVLLCGNGGSAADAQHISAELTGRFRFDRQPLDAEALSTNTSHLTAVGNDYSFDEIFARLVRCKGRSGDVLIVFSTSGNSLNIIRALEEAEKKEMIRAGFTGETGGKIRNLCNFLFNIPSIDTPRIQEMHILTAHVICDILEQQLFGEKNE